MKELKSLSLIILLILYLPSQTACQIALKKVRFIPHWYSQAQFAGYYMAYEKGIYKKYGINVTIIPGGSEKPSINLLKSGDVDFASTWLSTAIQRYSDGVKLVNIAQMVQKSALMFVTKKSSGIKQPKDMDGKKIGVWGGDFQLQPLAFAKQHNLSVNWIDQPNSLNLFFCDAVDVISAMWYNEYHTILNSGYNPDELNTFFFHNYNLNFPEDGIYCLEETYNNDIDLCRNFVNASVEGWQYAFDHPEMTLDVIIRYMKQEHLAANRPHQRWMLKRMKDLMFVEGILAGRLNKDNFLRVSGELEMRNIIKEIPKFESFYKDCITNVKK